MKLRYSPLIKQSVRLGEHINPHKKLSWKQANKLKNVVNRSKKQSDFGADLLEYRRLTSVYGGLTKSSFTKLSKAENIIYLFFNLVSQTDISQIFVFKTLPEPKGELSLRIFMNLELL